MKRSVVIMTMLCLLSVGILQAQQNSFYIGANGGVNLSKFKYTEGLSELYSSTKPMFGLNGGFNVGFEIQNFILATGVQYVQKGSEYQTDNFVDDIGTGFYAAQEKLHFISIPILVGYRKYFGGNFGLTFAMGPSINIGLSGKIDDETEYFGSGQVETNNYKVTFGESINDDYRNTQVGFQISPGLIFPINEKSKLSFNVTWDIGLADSFNPRYKSANDFFETNTGDQLNRSTLFTIGYEYHFTFGDKY